MSDLLTYTGPAIDGKIPRDLDLDSAMHDLTVDETDLGPVLAALIELFEMPPADDLSHPELYSRQREYQNSGDVVAELDRIEDARRMIMTIPEINPDSIDMEMNDGFLDVRFRLYSGRSGEVRL